MVETQCIDYGTLSGRQAFLEEHRSLERFMKDAYLKYENERLDIERVKKGRLVIQFGDVLHRFLLCGKQQKSIEVVSVYRAWEGMSESEQDGTSTTPTYVVQFTGIFPQGLASTRNFVWQQHSYALDELDNRQLCPQSHILQYAEPDDPLLLANSDVETPEIKYNVIMRLKRENDTFYGQELVREIPMMKEAVKTFASKVARWPRYRHMLASVPLLCFCDTASEVGLVEQPTYTCKILLFGYLNGSSGKLDDRIKDFWLNDLVNDVDAPDEPEDASLAHRLDFWRFAFVEDSPPDGIDALCSKQKLSRDWEKAAEVYLHLSDTTALKGAMTFGELTEKVEALDQKQ